MRRVGRAPVQDAHLERKTWPSGPRNRSSVRPMWRRSDQLVCVRGGRARPSHRQGPAGGGGRAMARSARRRRSGSPSVGGRYVRERFRRGDTRIAVGRPRDGRCTHVTPAGETSPWEGGNSTRRGIHVRRGAQLRRPRRAPRRAARWPHRGSQVQHVIRVDRTLGVATPPPGSRTREDDPLLTDVAITNRAVPCWPKLDD
jgi:hypothetical protein